MEQIHLKNIVYTARRHIRPKSGAHFMGMPKEPLKKPKIEMEKNGDIYAIV